MILPYTNKLFSEVFQYMNECPSAVKIKKHIF